MSRLRSGFLSLRSWSPGPRCAPLRRRPGRHRDDLRDHHRPAGAGHSWRHRDGHRRSHQRIARRRSATRRGTSRSPTCSPASTPSASRCRVSARSSGKTSSSAPASAWRSATWSSRSAASARRSSSRPRGTHVNTAETQHSGLITATQIEQVQVLGRDVTSIMRLLPGVRYENTVDSLGMSFGTSVPNVGGARRDWSNVIVDGVVGQRGRQQRPDGAADQPRRHRRSARAAEFVSRRVRARGRRPGSDRQQGRHEHVPRQSSTTTCETKRSTRTTSSTTGRTSRSRGTASTRSARIWVVRCRC